MFAAASWNQFQLLYDLYHLFPYDPQHIARTQCVQITGTGCLIQIIIRLSLPAMSIGVKKYFNNLATVHPHKNIASWCPSTSQVVAKNDRRESILGETHSQYR